MIGIFRWLPAPLDLSFASQAHCTNTDLTLHIPSSLQLRGKGRSHHLSLGVMQGPLLFMGVLHHRACERLQEESLHSLLPLVGTGAVPGTAEQSLRDKMEPPPRAQNNQDQSRAHVRSLHHQPEAPAGVPGRGAGQAGDRAEEHAGRGRGLQEQVSRSSIYVAQSHGARGGQAKGEELVLSSSTTFSSSPHLPHLMGMGHTLEA